MTWDTAIRDDERLDEREADALFSLLERRLPAYDEPDESAG